MLIAWLFCRTQQTWWQNRWMNHSSHLEGPIAQLILLGCKLQVILENVALDFSVYLQVIWDGILKTRGSPNLFFSKSFWVAWWHPFRSTGPGSHRLQLGQVARLGGRGFLFCRKNGAIGWEASWKPGSFVQGQKTYTRWAPDPVISGVYIYIYISPVCKWPHTEVTGNWCYKSTF